jgi:hypothetical protein
VGKTWESFKVKGDDLLGRVKEILHEGNVRRVVIKQGERTIVEFPVTVGVVGALAAPSLAAVGTLAALLTECTIEVERERNAPPPPPTVRVSRKKKS